MDSGGGGGGGGGGGAASTFWCYECDMSVMLILSGAPLSCPHCQGGFLEEMESRLQPPHLGFQSGIDNLRLPLLDHAGGDGIDDSLGDSVDLDDLMVPPIGLNHQEDDSVGGAEDYHDIFDRLISRIVSSASDDYDVDVGGGSGGGSGPRPASKSFVEAIPVVLITEEFLASDRFHLCAVCKDEFVLDAEAKQLPCNHIYHTDCILPWLSRHNSCPVCRFSLPAEDQDRRSPSGMNQLGEEGENEVERHARVVHNLLRSFFPGNDDAMVEAESDLLDIGSMLRRVRRRRQSLLRRSRISATATSSSPRLSRPELGSEGLTNSRERNPGRWVLDDEPGAGGSGTVDPELGFDHFRF